MDVQRWRFRILRVKPSYLETTPTETNVLVDFKLTRIRYMYSDSWIECPPITFLYTFNYSSPSPSSSSSDSPVSDVNVRTEASNEQRFPVEENETIFQHFSRYISRQLEHIISISSRSDNQSSRRRPSAIEIFAEGFMVEGTDEHPEMIQPFLNAFMADRTRGGTVEFDVVVDNDDDVIRSFLQTKKFQKRSDDDDDKELNDQRGDCSVCLKEYLEGEDVTVTPCGHMFHESCIWPWFSRGKETCPICRFNITQS